MRMTAHALGACLAFLLLAAPASASEVLVVGPHGARTVEDPYLPPRSASDLPPPSRSSDGSSRSAGRAPRARAAREGPSVRRALLSLYRSGDITREQYDEHKETYYDARRARRRLSGARRTELQDVIANVERIAAARRLTVGRLPALFLTLRRNTQLWTERAFPRPGARIAFGDDPVIFQYYAGEGVQIQPLANFGKANTLYNACKGVNTRPGTRCREGALRELLDRMVELAARRGTFTAWEYYFDFGGGAPPWISGLAQGTAVQALARGAELLGQPSYLEVAGQALGAFERRSPTGVRLEKGGGAHYLLYSFDRGLLVLNGFLQSVIALHDYARLSGDARGQALFEDGERVAQQVVPHYDTGAWSLYARRGRESDLGYHRLVRDFLRGLCERLGTPVYCDTGERFTRYLEEDPEIELLTPRPRRPRAGRAARARFKLSKVSAVSIHISRRGKVVFHRRIERVGYGGRSFRWVPPSPGRYRVRIEAADLRNHHEVDVEHVRVRRR